MAQAKILVADDSVTIQKVIKLALANEGYDILTVSDGREAFEQLSLFRPDVVLVDVGLPNKSGLELKREAAGIPDLADLRFVLMSSAFKQVDETQVQMLQFDGRLVKPFDPAHLREVLQNVLAMPKVQPQVSTPPAKSESNFELHEHHSQDSLEVPGGLDDDHFFKSQIDLDRFEKPQSSTSIRASADDEIRKLTEQTIKMSGMDDFQWTVDEPKLGVSNAPLATQTKQPSKPFTPTGELEFEEPAIPARHSVGAVSTEHDFMQLDEPLSVAPSKAASVFSLNDSDLEKLIQKQVEETLSKMIGKVLPDIAERLIKQEIHRMLNQEQ